MLRRLITAWRVHRASTELAALALRLGPHIARDVGLGHALGHPLPSRGHPGFRGQP